MSGLEAFSHASVVVLDDEHIALEGMRRELSRLLPAQTRISCFRFADEVLDFAGTNRVDVAFLDVCLLGEKSGVDVARELVQINPRVNIIFTTGYGEYAHTAFELHASGYLMKPISGKKIAQELSHLRYDLPEAGGELLRVKCFGNFDVFTPDGLPMAFARSKSRELMAYLICRHGARASIREAAAALFEDKTYDDHLANYMQQIIASLSVSLENAGAGEVLVRNRGFMAVNPALISCDYYDYLDGRPEARRAYMGEFLNQYSWAEAQHAFLTQDVREGEPPAQKQVT